ncbi:carbonic anhydrase [Rummeliibacillus sp. NPDC094406]|uniref:carbonic anhydrase n=1 Tax=Rummeliibacillus sp. NPDC094406 TaxID=3364511 RepID=UPI003817B568
MHINGKKKILFVMGEGHELEEILSQMYRINRENIIILQSHGQGILQPFDDFMREIILAVYQENIEEIFVIDTKIDQKNSRDLFCKIYENKELQEKIQIVDYLLKNCTPEFPESSIHEWLEGVNTVTTGVQKNAEIIRNHPLMPPNVKITELFIDKENGRLTDVDVPEKILL